MIRKVPGVGVRFNGFVQQNYGRACPLKVSRQLPIRQHHRGMRILQHQRKPLQRISGIQRHTRSTRLENAKHCSHHIRRPIRQ